MKQTKIITTFALFLLLLGGLTSCNDWTEMEAVDNTVEKPWEQNPELWAQYTAALRAYKASNHFIVYARLHNSPAAAASEKDFMRCLPDSLDIVSLTNADNFSKFDREDLSVMREKGTKVLYQVNYVARAEELNDAAKLGAYLDKVVASVKAEGLDGYSFTTLPLAEELTAQIVERLSAAKAEGQLLVFEGNPLSVAAADRDRIDYFILNTESTEEVLEVRLQTLNALNYAKIPAAKLLLAAEVGASLKDEDRIEYAAVEEMSRRVVEYGPLAGLAAYEIDGDYYNADKNYRLIRQAIQTLNPSK